jgi:hypothetical protein
LREDFIVTSNPSSNGKKKGTAGDGVAGSDSATPIEGYKVGRGRPPKEHQFKKGQSGNPKGRKPKAPSLLPDLKRIFEDALSEKVTVNKGDKEITLTAAEVGFKQLVAQFAKGDRHARRDVFTYAEKLGIDLLASHRNAIEEALAQSRKQSSTTTSHVGRRRWRPCRRFLLPRSCWMMTSRIRNRRAIKAWWSSEDQRPRRLGACSFARRVHEAHH